MRRKLVHLGVLPQKRNCSLHFWGCEKDFHWKWLPTCLTHLNRLRANLYQFMFLHFKSMNVPIFPTKDIDKTSLPRVFRQFKNVRYSVDCTQFFCQTPRIMGSKAMCIPLTSTTPQWKDWLQSPLKVLHVLLIYLRNVAFYNTLNKEMFCLWTKGLKCRICFCRDRLL